MVASMKLKKSMRCQSGSACVYFKQGNCRFYHPLHDKREDVPSSNKECGIHAVKEIRQCKFGRNCSYQKDGRCRFGHNNVKDQSVAGNIDSLENIIFIDIPKKQGFFDQHKVGVFNSKKKVSFLLEPQFIPIPSREELLENTSEHLWWTNEDYQYFRERESESPADDYLNEDYRLNFWHSSSFGPNVISPPSNCRACDVWGQFHHKGFSLFQNSLFDPIYSRQAQTQQVECFEIFKHNNTPQHHFSGWGGGISRTD